jgi:class 3 adenylate cyclase/pimeloyl-ACP methyl ester carboxylesterase
VDVPETCYVKSGDVSIAYQVAEGAGGDIVFAPRTTTPIDLLWDDPIAARGLRRLSACGRLIVCDLRGWGASDSIDTTGLPAMQAWMDDIGAVLDAAGSERATLMANSETGLPMMLFAATYPDRTAGLVLINGFARFLRSTETPFGMPAETVEGYMERYRALSGSAAMADWLAPTRSNEPAFRRWYARSQRLGAAPGTAAALDELFIRTDLSGVLPSIRVPVLLLHREGDRHVRSGHAAFLAERIPETELVMLPGEDNEWFSGDTERLFDEIERFVTGRRRAQRPDSVLATLLFTDIVGSTEQAASLGDRAWKDVLEAYHELLRAHLESFGGQLIETAGDGALATFTGPARAIYCACGIRDASPSLGLNVRVGLHTGEIELLSNGIGGLAVHIGARVAALAAPNEVLVSAAIPPLVAGSGIHFTPHGTHELKGVPEHWDIFAVGKGA